MPASFSGLKAIGVNFAITIRLSSLVIGTMSSTISCDDASTFPPSKSALPLTPTVRTVAKLLVRLPFSFFIMKLMRWALGSVGRSTVTTKLLQRKPFFTSDRRV